MTTAVGILTTVIFLLVSLVGTAGSGWILGDALSPERSGTAVGSYSVAFFLTVLAIAIEGLRLAISLNAERIWRRSQFQSVVLAGPLWLACTCYCMLMPLLLVAIVPLLPDRANPLSVLAPAWIAIQIAAGLLPGMRWPATERSTELPAVQVALAPVPRTGPAPEADTAASAEGFLRFLMRLSELPAGSSLPQRGRIGHNREILISQTGLALLVGRSKPTIRRWLLELERRERITKRAAGKDTCILVHQRTAKPNGEARIVNGQAHI